MKRALLIISVLLISTLVLSGCKDKTQTKITILGTWDSEGYIYEFKNDNTGNYTFGEDSIPFTYEDDGDKVVIQFDGSENINTYYYKIEKGKLIMKNDFNEDVTYIKK